ncbi:hypothetical protein M0R45_000975 [Rubus argutus]|uniref:MHC class I antigen n=1 Tax=Rubus argutus TaxID=59490 RepID=A0AAW1VRY0_RUBAR
MGCAGLIDGELSAVDIDGTVAEIRDGADSYDVGEARQSLGWCGGEQRDATGFSWCGRGARRLWLGLQLGSRDWCRHGGRSIWVRHH